MGIDLRRTKFNAKNGRRIDLIEKKHQGGGLTENETVELNELNEYVGNYVETRFPKDFLMLEEAEKRIARLKTKVTKKRKENGNPKSTKSV
jgi:hypothetical protein